MWFRQGSAAVQHGRVHHNWADVHLLGTLAYVEHPLGKTGLPSWPP
jgi:hypothetical protein